MSQESSKVRKIILRKLILGLLQLQLLIGSYFTNGHKGKDIKLGESIIDLEKKNTCELLGSKSDIFSDSIHSNICIVPEEGLHGRRVYTEPRKTYGSKNFGTHKRTFDNKIKRSEDNLGTAQFEKGTNKIRELRKNVDLDTLFGTNKDIESIGLKREAEEKKNQTEPSKGVQSNETNTLSLFRQGLLEYKEQKILKYYLFDNSNKKQKKRVVYPEETLSSNSAFNYLGDYMSSYSIEKVSSPTVVAWPVNHIVFINSQVNPDGTFKVVVNTKSGQIGFFFEISNGAYMTGCGSYMRTDRSKFTHGGGSTIQLQLVRRKFGFNVFVNGSRRPNLDIIDCISSVPTGVEITNGVGALIYPTLEDCKVSQWTDWSTCSKTCSAGTKVRYRSVIMPSMNGGIPCPTLLDTTSCNIDISCSPCRYSAWTIWSDCSTSCGVGSSVRTRTLIGATYFKESCIDTIEITTCRKTLCATDCIVTEWSDWSECSSTCDLGNQFSTRSIVQQESNGGTCDKELSRVQECNTAKCKRSCDPSPCLNGGICTELPMSNFVCICPPFYGGETCNSFELPWWIYYVIVVVAVFLVGIFYKLFISNIVTPDTMDPSYGDDGGFIFSQGPTPQMYQNDLNGYNYGYYNDNGYLANNNDGAYPVNDESNWMY
ncbi:thrombospondin type 1 domain-containing protein [Cryptosporidium felis]|nr:thrombospondin type 1 domain-containing protein [Cryptosporidium felis]